MSDQKPSQGADRWTAVRALFERALAVPVHEREALLAADADAGVAAEVRSLLTHHEADTGGRLSSGTAPPTAPSRIGERLGAWRISAPLGAGGMGEVWRAERADGAFAGAAAIKVLKRGMDSAAVLARFAQEQQALARLQHPHIAHLLDAGRTADGLPYFVMELAEGRPIDRACEGLGLEARLKLFLQLADAVAHAHRHLLVHRDLKPGNVLVTADGQVKLLDFGIAKAIDPLEGADAGALTAAGERPFTPHYASPEQVRGEPVGTATDVYSLGVLLYVLLTGQRPYGRQARTPAEAARSVLTEAPSRPSSLPPDPAADPEWARTRRRLQGDLDNVLLKALRKPPEERYAGVDALAADVRAYLDGYPVSARPASWAYRARKAVQRNPAATAAAALALLALIGGLGATAWQARAAALARDEARAQLAEIKRITTDLVFRYGDTVTTLPGGAKAQEGMLQATVASLEPALKGAPGDLDLVALMASALGRLAELQGNTMLAAPERAGDARKTVDRALALAEQAWAERLGDWRFASWHARTLVVDAQLKRGAGQLDAAAAALKLAAERSEAARSRAATDEGRAYLLAGAANAWLTLGQVYDHANLPSMNRPDDALAAFRESESRLRELLGQKALMAQLDAAAVDGDPATEVYVRHQIGTVLGGRALIQMRQERLDAMLEEAEAAVTIRRENVAREPKNVAWRDGLMTEANTLSIALIRLGRMPRALEMSTLAWDTAGELAASEGPKSKWAGARPLIAAQHGRALAGNGRHAEALEVFELGRNHWQAVQAVRPGPNPQRRIAWHQMHEAAALAALGRKAQALALAQGAAAALHPLLDDAAVGRDALLALAETETLLMMLDSVSAPRHRDAALAALDAAAGRRRLGADHQRLRARLAR